MATKQEITDKLDELQIKYPSNANKETLWALLPSVVANQWHTEETAAADAAKAAEVQAAADAAKAAAEAAKVPEPTDRESRWAAFLAKVEKQNPTRFKREKEAGEFDTIPDNWVA